MRELVCRCVSEDLLYLRGLPNILSFDAGSVEILLYTLM